MLDIALVVASRAWRLAGVRLDGVLLVCSSRPSLRRRDYVRLGLSHVAGWRCGRGGRGRLHRGGVGRARLSRRLISSICSWSRVSFFWGGGRRPTPSPPPTPP